MKKEIEILEIALPDPTPEDQQAYHDTIAPDLGTPPPQEVEGTEAKTAAERRRQH